MRLLYTFFYERTQWILTKNCCLVFSLTVVGQISYYSVSVILYYYFYYYYYFNYAFSETVDCSVE
jgi:hypothetical protein